MSRPQMLPPLGAPGGGPPPPGTPPPNWAPPASATPQEFRKRFDANDWKGCEEILKKVCPFAISHSRPYVRGNLVFQNPSLLNTPDEDGMTPVQMAIADGNIDILIELLKRPDLKINDALLHAVGKGDRIIVELVMVAMR